MTTKEMTKQDPQALESAREPRDESRQVIAPLCDILENDDEFLVLADMPGVAPNDVAIEFKNGELSLRAPRKGAGVDLFSGRKTSYEYERRFRVPAGVVGDKIDAALKNGVLTLRLPKEEARKPRQIPVKAA
jgi:HSP20 family molecular chaperone IbpA